MQNGKIVFPNISDFTIYRRSDDDAFWNSVGPLPQPKDEIQSLETPLDSDDGRTGRALLTSCYNGQYCSVRVRSALRSTGPQPVWNESSDFASGFRPSSNVHAGFLTSASDISEIIWQQLSRSNQTSDLTGLIVVSGGTGSGRSFIARALVDRYLRDKEVLTASIRKRTKLHLVTAEDPIERYMFDSPDEMASSPIDYTPRQRGRDFSDLRSALHDALRQSPSIMFVGEVRTGRDWVDLLDFSGTGHLAVTTCHAASLAETMSLVFRAAGAQSPVERQPVVARMLSVVNCRVFEVGERKMRAMVPSMWVRNDASKSALTSDGLASLVPGRSVDFASRVSGSLGRAWFASSLAQASAAKKTLDPMVGSTLERMVLEADLDGI